MTTYVLVGGAWPGGWCWQPIARQLRDNGHDAYPATLTGLGERVHGAAPAPAAADLPRRVAELVAAQFDTVAPVAEGCDALVATGVIPAGVWR